MLSLSFEKQQAKALVTLAVQACMSHGGLANSSNQRAKAKKIQTEAKGLSHRSRTGVFCNTSFSRITRTTFQDKAKLQEKDPGPATGAGEDD